MRVDVRWRKLLGDLRHTQGRIVMMVGALALGMSAMSAVLGAWAMLDREIGINYLGTHPASAHIQVDRVDSALLTALSRRPEVEAAEAGASLRARVQTASGAWMPALLFVIPDFAHARLNTVRPVEGAWPPPPGTVLIERAALDLAGAQLGTTLQVSTPEGGRHGLDVAGVVHDPGLAPAWQEQTVYGYITPATLALLGAARGPATLKIGLRDPALDSAGVERASAAIALWIGQHGYRVGEIRVPPPRMHPHQRQMQAILLMLLMFSMMALALSAILTATLIGAMLARQVRQIGVMKAIGARSWQIARLYLLMVLLISAAALAFGLPAGLAGSRGVARAIAALLNIELTSQAIPAWVSISVIAVGLLLPLLAALPPILGATRSTVRDAISDVGTRRSAPRAASGRGQRRLLAELPGIDRSLVLALRNPFRRPARLVMTLGLLAAAGAMFMSSLNVRQAWEHTLLEAASARRYDLELTPAEPTDEQQVLQLLAAVPGVRTAEAWNALPATVGRADGLNLAHTYPDGGHGSLTLRSAPPASTLMQHTLERGRWLQAGDLDAVVLNHTALAGFPGARVGGPIMLEVGGRRARYTLVGTVRETITPASAYVTPPAFALLAQLPGKTNSLRLAFHSHDAAASEAAAARVRATLEQAGIQTRGDLSRARLGEAMDGHVLILIRSLQAMALLMAAVGAAGLVSSMSSSVLERTREFGIMRTLGATSRAMLRNVICEGALIGLLSWMIALLLSLPLSWAIGRKLGQVAFRTPLTLTLSAPALGLWLAAILILAALASAWPARRAARLTIRTALHHQ